MSNSNDDELRAIKLLLERNKKQMLQDQPLGEGLIRVGISVNGLWGAIIELQCEIMSVSQSDAIRLLADQLIRQLLIGPGAITPEELLEQPASDQTGRTLHEVMLDVSHKMREKVMLIRVLRVAGPVGGYSHHDGKHGVLFQANGKANGSDILTHVAMHIAALKPTVTFSDELPPEHVAAERDRLMSLEAASGKTEDVVRRITDRQMVTFFAVNGVLVFQSFAMDDSKMVGMALAEQGFKAVGFTRWILGH